MRRPTAWFSVGVAVWAMVVTALRTVRPPNDFAEAHWLIDYRFGVVRRGLAGAMLHGMGLTTTVGRSEAVIQGVAYTVFGVFCMACLLVCGRLIRRLDWTGGALVLVLVAATSPFVVMNAHLMGYLDHLVFVFTLAAVWLVLRGHRWAAAVLGSAAVLTHENFLVVGFPALVFASLASAHADDGAGSRTPLTHLPLLLPVAVVAVLAATEAWWTDRRALQSLLTLHLQRYPFVRGDMHVFVPEWLMTSVADNVRAQQHRLLERLTNGPIILTVLPAVQALVFGAVACLAPHRMRMWGAAVIAVVCAPLVLHASAWDTARIWSYAIGAAFIMCWVASETNPAPVPFVPAPVLAVVTIPAIFANIVGRIPLLDGQAERFTNRTLLMLYAPVLISALAVGVTRSRNQAAPLAAGQPEGSDV
jgi:hypothetical protein